MGKAWEGEREMAPWESRGLKGGFHERLGWGREEAPWESRGVITGGDKGGGVGGRHGRGEEPAPTEIGRGEDSRECADSGGEHSPDLHPHLLEVEVVPMAA